MTSKYNSSSTQHKWHNLISLYRINHINQEKYIQGDLAELTITFEAPDSLSHAIFTTQQDFQKGEANRVEENGIRILSLRSQHYQRSLCSSCGASLRYYWYVQATGLPFCQAFLRLQLQQPQHHHHKHCSSRLRW